MKYHDVTVLTVIKDREMIPTDLFVKSVLYQTYPCTLMVVDFGSSGENRRWEEILFEKHGVDMITAKTNLVPFRESRALNIGIRRIETKYTILTNIDLVFGQTLVEEAMELLHENGNRVILCQRTDILQDGTTSLHAKTAYGAFFAVRTDWLIRVRGVDEKFYLWGAWDLDLMERAQKDGLIPVWVSDTVPVQLFHNWHPPAQKSENDENDHYRLIPNKPVVRNPEGWGEL